MKKTIEFIAFVCLSFVLYMGLSYALSDRETTFAATYSEPDNSLDVLIVGSSHVNSGYIPSILWEENNLSAVNTFSWSQPMWVSYHYIIEALKTQQPDTIVLEAYGMLYGHSYIMPQEIDKTSYANSFNLDPSINRLKLIKTSEFCGLDLRNAEEFLYISRYHSRWKDFNLSYLDYNPHKQHDYLKGYGYLTNIDGCPTPDAEISRETIVPYEYCVEYMEKIVNLCNEKGIHLVLTLAPYVYSTEDTGVINWLETYSREKGIPFFNYLYGDDYERINFDYSTDLSDSGHCNYFGAVKLTKDLSAYLAEQGKNRRSKQEHPYYEMLNEDFSRFARVPAISAIMENTTFDRWIAACVNDPAISLFVNTNSPDRATKDMLDKYFAGIGYADEQNKTVTYTTQSIDKVNNIYNFSMFGANGTVEFSSADNEIYLNGTAAPGDSNRQMKIILYDNILQRPVISAWGNSEKITTKEFTSDILDNYK